MDQTQPAQDSISAFFPAYNDWGTIASMVVLVHRVLEQLTDDFEVIVVNDASPDHVGEILAELTARYPRLRIVTHDRNRGYGGALKSGFAAASKTWVFYTDGDAQYDVRELRDLWARRQGQDVVNGYKIHRSDPWYRAVIGRMYHHFVSRLFRIPVRDVDCDFRLIRREVLERIALTEDSGLICVELMAKIARTHCRIAQVPVHHFHRLHGKSQFFNFSRVLRVFLQMIKLWWRLDLRREPVGPVTGTPRPAAAPVARDSSGAGKAP
jgi:glycosyltransferase involved in cell wall biosynthesis